MFSYSNAVVISFGGMLSSYAGGRWADEWEARGNSRARLQVPAIGALTVVPIMVGARARRRRRGRVGDEAERSPPPSLSFFFFFFFSYRS